MDWIVQNREIFVCLLLCYACSSQEEWEMRVSDQDLQVKEVCASQQCLESCLNEVRDN